MNQPSARERAPEPPRERTGWWDFLFSFRGRLGRGGFWLYNAIAVPLLAIFVIAFWVYALSAPGAYENGGPTPFPDDPLGMAGAVLFFAVLAAILLAGTAITVRRLHDRDRAWWWILVFVWPASTQEACRRCSESC